MISRTIVAGLAATRLVRAWKYEVIGEKPREALLGYLNTPVLSNGDQVNLRATAVREFVAELVDCPHCLSVHFSILCALGLRVRGLRPVIEGLAAAMIASVFVQWMPGYDFSEPDPPEPTKVVLMDSAEAAAS